jgi:hypothetical protein
VVVSSVARRGISRVTVPPEEVEGAAAVVSHIDSFHFDFWSYNFLY